MKLASRRTMAATEANHADLTCVRILRRAAIGAMIAPSEICKHLVADGAHAGGKIVDAYALSDQGGETAAARGAFGKVGDVDGEEIHGDAAGDGTAPACHHDLGGGLALGGRGRAQEAGGIAERHGGDAA